MKTFVSLLVLTGFCSATLVALPEYAHAEESSSSKAKKKKRTKKSSKSRKKEDVKSEDVDPVVPEDTEPTPEALAQSANALPEPPALPPVVADPSMNTLLAEGGGVPVEQVEGDFGVTGSSGGAGGGALALGFGLFLVGGGLGAGVVVARQKKKAGLNGLMPAHHLKHVKSIRLSPKHQISLIEAQGKQLVVGITSAQMTLLATLDDPEDFELDQVLAPTPELADKGAEQDWNNLFTNALKQRDANISGTQPPRKPEQAPKPAEPLLVESEVNVESLPPVIQHASVPLRAEAEAEPELADDASSFVAETEDYTLEETPELDEVPRHDGIFSEHDAVHHTSPTEPITDTSPRRPVRATHKKARRSRESDSMLIALAAMREEAS